MKINSLSVFSTSITVLLTVASMIILQDVMRSSWLVAGVMILLFMVHMSFYLITVALEFRGHDEPDA